MIVSVSLFADVSSQTIWHQMDRQKNNNNIILFKKTKQKKGEKMLGENVKGWRDLLSQ